MKQIDESRLETDLTYRFEYLAEFIGFTEQDASLINSLSDQLSPKIEALVEATYDKMLSYTSTARHFLQRQNGCDGPLTLDLNSLNHSDTQVQFRKEHLRRYLTSILGNTYDARMTKYLDVVGKIHTPRAGNKQIDVPLVQMNALMGLLNGILINAIFELELDRKIEQVTIQAFNKLMWIQNDLINRHYSGVSFHDSSKLATPPPKTTWR